VAEKIDRKQLKRPDEFQVVAGRRDGLDGRAPARAAGGRPPPSGRGADRLGYLGVARFTGVQGERGDSRKRSELLSRPVAGDAQAQPGEQTFPSKE